MSLVVVTAAVGVFPFLTEVSTVRAADVTVGTGDYTCDENGFEDALADVVDGDTIFFDCGAADSITFTSRKTIDKTVTIDGGDQITLSGGESTRLFSIDGSSDGDLTLQDIRLVDGFVMSHGGAIHNSGGELTATRTTFSNNVVGSEGTSFVGGAIYNTNGGNLNVSDSIFSDNLATGGGAIYTSLNASSTITSSTFVENEARASGGVFFHSANSGPSVIANTTFVNNSAQYGGAIAVQGSTSSSITITSSTFSGNVATELSHTIANGGTITVTASILVAEGTNCVPIIGSTTLSGGYNLTSDDSCGFGETGDFEGNANLGELASNGGPTRTMLPGPDSDAIDAIPADFCGAELPETDQRGFDRTQFGNQCDIGAVEAHLSSFPEQTLCANRYNGDLRMPRTDACASTEMVIELPDEDGVDLCVNRYNGATRHSRTGACASTETAIQVQGTGDQSVCVNRYNGDLRVPRVDGQCASTETARVI